VQWLEYQPWRQQFAEAMDPRLYDLFYLDTIILTGKARCWANERAAIVAELKTYPTGAMAVHGLIAAGDIDEIERLIPLAEQWGREEGCILALIESREGWGRVMKKYGYAPFQATIAKEL
jgi:hypothetical protein